MGAVFGIAFPYIAIIIFMVGFACKVVGWAKRPVPFCIPTTAGQQKSLPWIKNNPWDNPYNASGVFMTPPKWVKILAIISVIWAFSIHTVTAFLYAGLPGRHYFLTAIMAARFLASAFCSGPAILLLLVLLLRRLTGFDPGKKAINRLAVIITYAMIT